MSNTYVHPITGEVLTRVPAPPPPPPALQEQVESSSSERSMMISDYFARFVETLAERFQENDMGEDHGLYFYPAVFVSRDNKRRVVFYVTNGLEEEARTLTRVSYIFPMSEEAAKALYRLEEAQPDEGPTFADITVPAGQTVADFITTYAAGNNLVEWNQEMRRVKALVEEAKPGKIKRTLGNLIYYWKTMRGRLLDAIHQSVIRVMHTSSGSLRSSEKVRRRRSTSARTRPSSVSASPSSGSRRATTGKRSSSGSRHFSSGTRKTSSKGSRITSSKRATRRKSASQDPRGPTSDPI